MSPAMAAHLRMLAILPVRTHHAPEPEPASKAWVRKSPIPKWKQDFMRKNDGKMPRREIARRVKLAGVDVSRFLGPAKLGGRRR